jgi:hypothetical protein
MTNPTTWSERTRLKQDEITGRLVGLSDETIDLLFDLLWGLHDLLEEVRSDSDLIDALVFLRVMITTASTCQDLPQVADQG